MMTTRTSTVRRMALVAGASLALAACGSSSDGEEGATTTPDEAEATVATEPLDEPVTTESATTESATTEIPEEDGDDGDGPAPTDPPEGDGGDGDTADGAAADFRTFDPPTGETIVIGMVNTEGTPGLDFPEMRTDTDLAVDFLNEHGGFGGRPIEVVHCTAAGSPETSQTCAQEMSGEGVELVMLGLDLFPGYDTYGASDIPVFGALPILPGDFTADALFSTGGNATTMAGMAGFAVEEFGAQTVGIISADNAGANSSEAALTGALDKAGVSYSSIKGGDNETDAGFQGLMREAAKDNPDVLVSLYDDAGCIGAIRARVSLGLDIPTISTPICGSAEVIDVVGDDALGWYFVGAGASDGSASAQTLDEIIEPAYGDGASGSLGLGALGIGQVMGLARVANALAVEGVEITGAAMYERLETSEDIVNFPNEEPFTCGSSTTYPSVCIFAAPVGAYAEGGELITVPGFESFSVIDYLP
jgi:branched-chain amino acid transport system substrate-binding protein